MKLKFAKGKLNIYSRGSFIRQREPYGLKACTLWDAGSRGKKILI